MRPCHCLNAGAGAVQVMGFEQEVEQSLQRIVLTGGPGAGKTSVLASLRRRGFATGEDAARSIIRARKQAGLAPRPEALPFARQVLDREIEAYDSAPSSPFFYERGVVDSVASLVAAGGLSGAEAKRLLADYPYQAVFLFPPWEDIYCMDEERDHTFAHAENVYQATLTAYRHFGYEPVEVPRSSVEDRVAFILSRLPQ